MVRSSGAASSGLASDVVEGALPVDRNQSLVADDVGIVARRDFHAAPRPRFELGAILEDDVQTARELVLEMGVAAPVGARSGLDALRPAPARLQRELADGAIANLDQLELALRKGSHLIRLTEFLQTVGRHRSSPWCFGCRAQPALPLCDEFYFVAVGVVDVDRLDVQEWMLTRAHRESLRLELPPCFLQAALRHGQTEMVEAAQGAIRGWRRRIWRPWHEDDLLRHALASLPHPEKDGTAEVGGDHLEP